MMITQFNRNRLAAFAMVCCLDLALASAASAVDLRDWGRKFPTSQRFVLLSQFNNQAVLDKETQLVWQRTPSSDTGTWQGAVEHCLRLELGGRLGWRLPTVPELASLIRPNAPGGSLALPIGHPFENVQLNAVYWTANQPRDSSGQPFQAAYGVSFSFGGGFFHLHTLNPRLRWCVRGGVMLSD